MNFDANLQSEHKKRIENEDWDALARLAHAFEFEVTEKSVETAKLIKELQMIKKVVHAYISHEKHRKTFLSPKFLLKMYATIQKLENKIKEHERMHGEFVAFLEDVLHKMKQEKLVVYKTLEKTQEFQKHKNFEDVL